MSDVSRESKERWNRAVSLFIESLYKPDHELRSCAHNQECYHELMYFREDMIRYAEQQRVDL